MAHVVALAGVRAPTRAFRPSTPARAMTCRRRSPGPDAPAGTKSFALIVDDPDAPDPKAPRVVWVHWVLYNLPADVDALPEGSPRRCPPGRSRGSTT